MDLPPHSMLTQSAQRWQVVEHLARRMGEIPCRSEARDGAQVLLVTHVQLAGWLSWALHDLEANDRLPDGRMRVWCWCGAYDMTGEEKGRLVGAGLAHVRQARQEFVHRTVGRLLRDRRLVGEQVVELPEEV